MPISISLRHYFHLVRPLSLRRMMERNPLIYCCFSGTQVIWGVNFGQNNLTAAFLEATAIASAFTSATFRNLNITLEAIEIGNEADLYTSNGARDNTFNVQEYVSQYVYTSRISSEQRRLLVYCIQMDYIRRKRHVSCQPHFRDECFSARSRLQWVIA